MPDIQGNTSNKNKGDKGEIEHVHIASIQYMSDSSEAQIARGLYTLEL